MKTKKITSYLLAMACAAVLAVILGVMFNSEKIMFNRV